MSPSRNATLSLSDSPSADIGTESVTGTYTGPSIAPSVETDPEPVDHPDRALSDLLPDKVRGQKRPVLIALASGAAMAVLAAALVRHRRHLASPPPVSAGNALETLSACLSRAAHSASAATGIASR